MQARMCSRLDSKEKRENFNIKKKCQQPSKIKKTLDQANKPNRPLRIGRSKQAWSTTSLNIFQSWSPSQSYWCETASEEGSRILARLQECTSTCSLRPACSSDMAIDMHSFFWFCRDMVWYFCSFQCLHKVDDWIQTLNRHPSAWSSLFSLSPLLNKQMNKDPNNIVSSQSNARQTIFS